MTLTSEPLSSSKVKLPSGDLMPRIGLGCWQSSLEELAPAVEHALRVGYKHIDGAAIYGNEEAIGEGLKRSGLPREEVWITTKLWNTEHHPRDVIPALKTSLKKMGLDYVELWLMHYPAANEGTEIDKIKCLDISYVDTWKAMEEAVQLGLAKNIGISNFSRKEIENLLQHCKIVPALHQMERHCYLPQNAFMKFHRDIGMHVTAYSPLGNTNPSFADRDGLPPILKNPVVCQLAEKHRVSPANILISLQLAEGNSVLPKSVNPDRISENLKVVNLSDEEVSAIAESCKGHRRRYCDFGHITMYNFYEGLDDDD